MHPVFASYSVADFLNLPNSQQNKKNSTMYSQDDMIDLYF